MELNQITVPLDKPIMRGETKIESITLTKPNSGALRGTKLADLLQMDVAAVSVVLPRISNPTLTKSDIENLDAGDLTALATEVASFLLPNSVRG